jgi:opacity protein-like surface antigen
MKRFAGVVCSLIVLLALSSSAFAQPAADDSRYYAEFNGGATFGHKSSGSIGGEFGYKLTGPYTIFVEGGRMFNVGTQALDDRANIIASQVGATASSSYKVNFFDGGLRYDIPMSMPHLRPYLAIGFGFAAVKAETAFAVNGTTVPPESLGISLGDDLNGTINKAIFTIGGGVTYPFGERYFIDGTFRYGRIFPRTGVVENDKGINTARLQIGAGVRF